MINVLRCLAFILVLVTAASTSFGPAMAGYWTATHCPTPKPRFGDYVAATIASANCVNRTFERIRLSTGGGIAFGEKRSPLTGGWLLQAGATMGCESGEDTKAGVGGGPASCVPIERENNYTESCMGKTGNPIATHTGNKEQTFVDWTSGGVYPLVLQRNYSADYQVLSAPGNTIFGLGWRSNFDAVARYTTSSGGDVTLPRTPVNNDRIHIVLPDHREYHFRFTTGKWVVVAPTKPSTSVAWTTIRTDIRYSIGVVGNSAVLRMDDNSQYAFDETGLLKSITLPNGMTQSMWYDGTLLVQVRDSFGRSLDFLYENTALRPARVTKVRTGDGKDFLYDYAAPIGTSALAPGIPAVLSSVAFPDATPMVSTDNPRQFYSYADLYVDPLIPSASLHQPLSMIVDEKGVTYATWSYDVSGRAVASSHAGGSDNHTLQYSSTGPSTTVINPLGKVAIYTYNKLPGKIWQLKSVEGQASANCALSNTSFGHDSNGFRNKVTDAEGRITSYTNDALGRPTSIVESTATAPNLRTVTMTWDPIRPLVTQVVEPGKTTSVAYNTDSQVATHAETDTTVVGGQTRTTTFGYTPFALPQPPAISSPQTSLADLAMTVTNPGATVDTSGWTNQVGAISRRDTSPCAAPNACFAGGTAAFSVAYQDIVIPAANIAEVDAGQRAAELGWIQAGATDADSSTMRMQFLDATNTLLSASVAPLVDPPAWTTRKLAHPIPVGTRKVRIFMVMKRPGSGGNDGYIDDIAFKLVSDGARSATPYLTVANPSAEVGSLSGWTAEYDTAFFAGQTPPANPVTVVACDYDKCFNDNTLAAEAIVQDIVIPSAFVASVDAEARSVNVSWLSRILTEEEGIALELVFLNASNAPIGTLQNISKVVSRDPEFDYSDSFARDVPSGTRKIRLRFKLTTMLAQNGGTTTGYFVNKTFLSGITAQLFGRAAAPPAVNLLTSVNGPLAGTGDTVSYTYNSSGAITSVTNEVGHVTTVTAHTANGLPASITDPNGVVTTLAYNPRDWLTSVTVNPGAAQAVTTIAYNAIGQVTRVTEPDGAYLDYTYSNARRLTTVTNNTGEVITYTHNVNGDMTSSSVKSSANAVTKQMTMTYDELGRMLKSIGAAAQETAYSYDRTDLTTQLKDPRNNLYGYSYDGLQRLVRTTDQVGAQVNVTRNGQDDVTAYQDPRSITTSYVRNGFGEVIQEVSPDAGTTTFTRDARGLVTSETDGRGVVTNRSYDNAGRMLTESYPADVAENVTYSYDNVTAGNKGKGRLTGITDQSGSIAYIYDALGRVITDTRVMNAKTYVTQYQYNAADRLTQITYPSGRIVTYARNANGQVTGVTTKQTAAAAVVNVATGITYAPQSDLVNAMTHGNGLQTSAGYDLDYRLTSLAVNNGATPVSSLAYAYTDGMNLTGITDNLTAANSNTLWYTAANRLQNANGPWGATENYYDVVGNRTYNINTVSSVATTREQSYAANSNRLTSITENTAAFRSYTYDNAGNTLTETRPGESFAYTYNKRNRLASVTRNAAAYASYSYNALEQLTSRSTAAVGAPAGTVHYLYDQDTHLIAEANAATGAITRDYIWLASNDNDPIDLPLAIAESSTLTTAHADHLGRPTRMTDAAKATVWQATWKPWGEIHQLSGTSTQNLRYPGQYFQIETGLHYNHHRNYDPITGRYTQPDPLRFVDGPSIYAYAGNSPYMYVDREGRAIFIPFLIGAAIGVGIEYALNGECATWRDYAFAAGFGALGGVGGKLAYLPWQLRGRAMTGSHWIPARYFRPGPRKLNPLKKGFNPRLPKRLDGAWNKNVSTRKRHFKHDPHYFGNNKDYVNWGNKLNPVLGQLDRTPDMVKGAVIGGVLGSQAYGE